MHDYLAFRRFITPVVIQIIFWIGVGVSVIRGVALIATIGGANGIITGLIVLFVGPIAVRVACELIMAVFRIHEALTGGKGD